ncbi:MAG: hypothetical protein FD161_2094 [Limisphaerales bacterium]|nr:MAG: hypothetical protein FD161_2094 [Limisphaerales bacterium]KAG0508999.1 MAG: hypothetical protein E1N63_1896 [Limisphaerales bacterium]TXT51280.1 MAG: hypothetical protein FD140_1739 [Limisphaerales bacterium]
MLLFKRLVTTAVVFALLFCLLFVGALAVGGIIVSSRAIAKDPATKNRVEIAEKAGEEFGDKYGDTIGIGALVIAFPAALALAFSGTLPWCRKKPLLPEASPAMTAPATVPPPIPHVPRKPHGFDPGLRCLLAVFVFWLAVRFYLPRANTPSLALEAMMFSLSALFGLITISLVVWYRCRDTENPARGWAIGVAVVWASGQLATWIIILVKTFV